MKTNQSQFKETFSQVHASSACLEEVYHMTESRKTRRPKRFIARRLAVLAAGAIALAGSTIAVNAATGNRLLRYFTVIIDGKEYRAEEIDGKENVYQMENGTTITFTHPTPSPLERSLPGRKRTLKWNWNWITKPMKLLFPYRNRLPGFLRTILPMPNRTHLV